VKIQSVFSRPAVAPLALIVLGMAGLGAAAWNRSTVLSLKIADPSETNSHTGFAPVVKQALPSVVNISSSKVVKTQGPDMGQVPPMFRQFFGDDFQGQGMPRSQREQSLGSGVIVTTDGYLLTNNHVVDGATDVKVMLSDKRELKARVVGTDAKTDIAVLKVDASNLTPLVIGDSSKVQVGDYALAIGNPFGVGQTVTMGIVSALGRNNLGIEAYEDFIQTDAPINPGNSGGALINDHGQLVGINTAIISHGSGGNQGIGFAVPINLARQVMEAIVKDGHVTRAYLGIVPQDVTPALAKAFGQTDLKGALVGDISPDGPAAKSDLKKGDIIVAVNGKPVADSNQLRLGISMMQPGTPVTLDVLREGQAKQVALKLDELPTQEARIRSENGSKDSSLEGVNVESLDAQTARELRLPADTNGVVVTDVDPGSHAAEAGLRKGDVIQEVNHQSVKSVSDFERMVGKSKDTALLLVNRFGNTLYVAV
jgi:serine protease Do